MSRIGVAATAAAMLAGQSAAFTLPAGARVQTPQALLQQAQAQAATSQAVETRYSASATAAAACVGAAALAAAGIKATSKHSKKAASKRVVSLNAFESELGVQPPVGFWDPLGFTADGNADNFKRRRAVELKHGRVCMLASMGYIVPYYTKFSGELSPSNGLKFEDVPNGLAAISKVPSSGWWQIIAFVGYIELFYFTPDESRAPGDYANAGSLGVPRGGFGSPDEETRKKKLSAELANGRLAMMAIIGMFYQDGLTGSAWGDWALYTDSPLRAFETELGVQPPVGFWDPLGLAADGDAEVFKRRRGVEIKHGRICMLACIGYIVPYYFKFPGYLAPKESLTFDDVPNGLAALLKVPGPGWTHIVMFIGCVELFVNKQVGDEPGNFGKGQLGTGFLPGVADAEARKRKLSAELANGRLAMMAIIGMFFQDGLTGSAWGDWANYTASPLR